MHLRSTSDANKHKICNKLFLRNVDPTFLENDIADYIEICGDIQDITILRDKDTGKSRGLAFVKCYKETVAEKILRKFNETPMGMTIIHIDYAKDKIKN